MCLFSVHIISLLEDSIPILHRGRGGVEDSDSGEEDFEEREKTRAAATYGTDAALLKAATNKQKVKTALP